VRVTLHRASHGEPERSGDSGGEDEHLDRAHVISLVWDPPWVQRTCRERARIGAYLGSSSSGRLASTGQSGGRVTKAAEVGSTANRYEILAKLATGGMAEIFLARGASAAGVERYVVLKRILRDKAHDTHFVQMFLEEARLAAQLQHPNVAQVYAIGTLGAS